jgi:hypothetical protein
MENFLLLNSFTEEENILKYLKYLNYSNKNDSNMKIIPMSQIKNKLWHCFLNNEGSMTKMMNCLFGEEELKFQLGYNKLLVEDSICQEIVTCLENLLNCKIESKEIIARKITFSIQDGIKMVALSFWNNDFYNNLYKNPEDENKPLGLLILEKEIEYYRYIENYIFNIKEGKIIFRLSKYKSNKTISFLLIEIFNSDNFIEFFGELE